MEWPEISWVDIAVLGVLALSIAVGLVRGLVLEVLSLLGWFAAWFGAAVLGPWIAPHLPAFGSSPVVGGAETALGSAGSGLNRTVAFACAFILILIVWAIGTRLVAAIVRATPLRPIDRVLGGVFGALRAAVVLLVVALVVSWTPLSQDGAWRRSVCAQWLESALAALRSMVP